MIVCLHPHPPPTQSRYIIIRYHEWKLAVHYLCAVCVLRFPLPSRHLPISSPPGRSLPFYLLPRCLHQRSMGTQCNVILVDLNSTQVLADERPCWYTFICIWSSVTALPMQEWEQWSVPGIKSWLMEEPAAFAAYPSTCSDCVSVTRPNNASQSEISSPMKVNLFTQCSYA